MKPFGAAAAVRVPTAGVDTQADEVNGRFEVPLPQGQPSGTYTLNAALGPDTSAARAIPNAVLLNVKVGNAALTFDDSSPLRAAAGADHPVAGALLLEDGSPLAARTIDLGFLRGSTGSDHEPDAGFLPPAPDTIPVTSAVATTAADGSFEVVLSDPAEEGQGTELGGEVRADTAATPGIGNAVAGSSLAADLVSQTPPSGSTCPHGPRRRHSGTGTAGQAHAHRP